MISIGLTNELEQRIARKVQSGLYRSPAEVIEAGLELLEAKEATAPESMTERQPVWQTVADIGNEVSPEVWSQVPTDLARNLDHHLYRDAKTSE